tara:strand:+ start:53 stop:517 length:465 start_codon:yes stop_codon:yes gene_type:complete
MRFYKLFSPTLLFCVGCTLDPTIFGLSSNENTSNNDTNPLIPRENIITRSNKNKYSGQLVYKVVDVELSATQADDFILVVNGVTETNVAYAPRLVQINSEQPNTLRFSFKAIHETNKRKDEGTVTAALTITTKELENIDKILIESKRSTFELKL